VNRTLATVLILSCTGLPALAAPVVLSADETLDLPLVITSQSKAQSAVSMREVADAVIRSLSAELPGITLRHLVDGDVDACRLDVTCLAETRAMLPPSPRTTGGLMVIVETSPSGPALSLFAWVYDLEAIALKRSHGELPESIQASTSRCESVPTEVADAAALDEALRVALAPCTAPLRARLIPRSPCASRAARHPAQRRRRPRRSHAGARGQQLRHRRVVRSGQARASSTSAPSASSRIKLRSTSSRR
jgi:hypothetical protein